MGRLSSNVIREDVYRISHQIQNMKSSDHFLQIYGKPEHEHANNDEVKMSSYQYKCIPFHENSFNGNVAKTTIDNENQK